jgi:hypothetical protein
MGKSWKIWLRFSQQNQSIEKEMAFLHLSGGFRENCWQKKMKFTEGT